MNISALGSTFEISLRILLLLDEVHENLHGCGNYRFSEYPARQHLVSSALKELILDGYARLLPSATGYRYSITADGNKVCEKLTSNYAGEYRIAVQAVIDRFDNADADMMLREINRLTVQSLKEVGHE